MELPSQVEEAFLRFDIVEMSAVQSLSGAVAAKFLSTRSGAGVARRSRRVVLFFRLRMHPRTPALRIRRATRLRPQRTPKARSSACTCR